MSVNDQWGDQMMGLKPRASMSTPGPKPVNSAAGSFTNTHAAQAEMRMTRPQTPAPSFTAKVGSTSDYGYSAPVTRQRAARSVGAGRYQTTSPQIAMPIDFGNVMAAAHPHAGKETGGAEQHLSEEQFGHQAQPAPQPAPQEQVPQHTAEHVSRGGGLGGRTMPPPPEA